MLQSYAFHGVAGQMVEEFIVGRHGGSLSSYDGKSPNPIENIAPDN